MLILLSDPIKRAHHIPLCSHVSLNPLQLGGLAALQNTLQLKCQLFKFLLIGIGPRLDTLDVLDNFVLPLAA